MGFETKTIRIAMNGITGRMGYRQHLLRSILPIRDAGGLTLEDGTKVQIEPILVGRNEAKIRELAELHKISEWTTDLDGVINDPTVDVIFDASMTSLRAAPLKKAMLSGKPIFTICPMSRATSSTRSVIITKSLVPRSSWACCASCTLMTPSSLTLELLGREHNNCTPWAHNTVDPQFRPLRN